MDNLPDIRNPANLQGKAENESDLQPLNITKRLVIAGDLGDDSSIRSSQEKSQSSQEQEEPSYWDQWMSMMSKPSRLSLPNLSALEGTGGGAAAAAGGGGGERTRARSLAAAPAREETGDGDRDEMRKELMKIQVFQVHPLMTGKDHESQPKAIKRDRRSMQQAHQHNYFGQGARDDFYEHFRLVSRQRHRYASLAELEQVKALGLELDPEVGRAALSSSSSSSGGGEGGEGEEAEEHGGGGGGGVLNFPASIEENKNNFLSPLRHESTSKRIMPPVASEGSVTSAGGGKGRGGVTKGKRWQHSRSSPQLPAAAASRGGSLTDSDEEDYLAPLLTPLAGSAFASRRPSLAHAAAAAAPAARGAAAAAAGEGRGAGVRRAPVRTSLSLHHEALRSAKAQARHRRSAPQSLDASVGGFAFPAGPPSGEPPEPGGFLDLHRVGTAPGAAAAAAAGAGAGFIGGPGPAAAATLGSLRGLGAPTGSDLDSQGPSPSKGKAPGPLAPLPRAGASPGPPLSSGGEGEGGGRRRRPTGDSAAAGLGRSVRALPPLPLGGGGGGGASRRGSVGFASIADSQPRPLRDAGLPGGEGEGAEGGGLSGGGGGGGGGGAASLYRRLAENAAPADRALAAALRSDPPSAKGAGEGRARSDSDSDSDDGALEDLGPPGGRGSAAAGGGGERGEEGEEEGEGEGGAIAATARTRFLFGCVDARLAPRANLVLRKLHTTQIRLAHQGMGDELGKAFAECLRDLPLVQHVDVTDNRLTDASLEPLLRALRARNDVLTLNLSQNKMDERASDALLEYLRLPSCALVSLVMSKSDIDDDECCNLLDALAHNRNLTSLDLSHNLIGTNEVMNVVQPDYTTGGEAVAESLEHPNCKLRALNLSWNLIRLESAVALGEALAGNTRLTELNLAYNAFGKEGGEAVGKALYENRTLKLLDLSNNNLTPRAAFVIAVALRANEGLNRLELNGNPLGEYGGKALMTIASTARRRLDIGLKACNFTFHDDECWFNPADPEGGEAAGVYRLDMTDAYEFAVMLDILQLAAREEGFRVVSLVNTNQYGEKETIELERRRAEGIIDLQSEESPFKETPEEMFRSIDADGSGHIDLEELKQKFHELGLKDSDAEIKRIMEYYDKDQSGEIEIDEFNDIVVFMEQEIKEKSRSSLYMARKGEAEKWQPPPLAKNIRVKIRYDLTQSQDYDVFTYAHRLNVMHLCESADDRAKMIELTLGQVRLQTDEAEELFFELRREYGSVERAMEQVLPSMAGPHYARLLLATNVRDPTARRLLRQRMGAALPVLLGITGGHYRLDLSKTTDRLAFRKVVEVNNMEKKNNRESGRYDTSQHGNWDNFRNVKYNFKPIQTLPRAMMVAPPHSGLLEFDYVTTTRPPANTQAMTFRRFCAVLEDVGLVTGADQERLQALGGLGEVAYGPRAPRHVRGRPFYVQLCCEYGDRLPRPEDPSNDYLLLRRPGVKLAGTPADLLGSAPTSPDSDAGRKAAGAAGQSKGGDGVSPLGRGRAFFRPGQEGYGGGGGGGGGQEEGDGGSLAGSSLASSVEATPRSSLDAPSHLGSILRKSANKVGKLSAMMKKQSRSTSQRLKELHDIPAHNDHQAWIKRLSKSCKDSSKVRDLLFNTQMAMIDRYFTAEQLRYLLLRYHGSKEEKKDIAILGFSRIVDLRNFDIVLEIFSQEEQANLIARLGVLNCWNPLKPDGYIECDIGRREERQVARMLVALAEAEPGKNFLNESFRWNRVEPPMPGWVLPETWFKEETLPHRGVLCVEYYSGEGRGLNGCAPEVELRLALAGVVTLCEPDPEALQDYPDLVFDQTRTKIWLDQLNLRLDFTAGVPRVGALT